jgi:hypothetical protein
MLTTSARAVAFVLHHVNLRLQILACEDCIPDRALIANASVIRLRDMFMFGVSKMFRALTR